MDAYPQELPSALPDLEVCRRARESRDARFDGRFFVGVVTTGVFCRPTCPARLPLEANVRYYATSAQAQAAGFRPCKRCRPEAALRLPEWTLASDTVLRGLRLIESGFLNGGTSADLARKLGIGERQLSRLFAQELGASPTAMAQLCRAKLAKKLLVGTRMKHVDIAYHSGFGSISRFNAEIKKVFHATPREIRAGAKKNGATSVEVTLPIRGPYHFDWMFEYLDRRALKGLEHVSGEPGTWRYERRVGADSYVVVRQQGDGLVAELPLTEEPLHSLLVRVRRVFDLNADGAVIHEDLRQDRFLREWVDKAPGLRVPGAWDGFETAVRAILGQQVSVERGTELANKMIDAYGAPLGKSTRPSEQAAANHFPTAAQLVDKTIAEIGMPGQRGRAISSLAGLATSGTLTVDECQDFDEAQTQLLAISGVGPWTVNYIRMRALKDPDAFPDNDWVVMKALDCTAKGARARAEAWRPWRAYALMYVWYASKTLRERLARSKQDKQSTQQKESA